MEVLESPVLSQVRFGGSTTYINYDSGVPALQMYIGQSLKLSQVNLETGEKRDFSTASNTILTHKKLDFMHWKLMEID